jgi:hypothetical protein
VAAPFKAAIPAGNQEEPAFVLALAFLSVIPAGNLLSQGKFSPTASSPTDFVILSKAKNPLLFLLFFQSFPQGICCHSASSPQILSF